MNNTLTVYYFIGELYVPNAIGSSAVNIAKAKNVDWFIAKYEPKFLELLMGTQLYEAYLDGITAEPDPEERFVNLKNKIFIEDTTNEFYYSPAANYVYYHIMRDSLTMTTSTGEVKPDNKTTLPQPTNNVMKMVQAWNQMTDECEKIWEWLEDNPEIYPEFDPYQKNPFGKMNMFNI